MNAVNAPAQPPVDTSAPEHIPPAQATDSEHRREARRRALRRFLTSSPAIMGGVLLGIIVLFSILRPNAFPTAFNARNVLLDGATLLVMAVAMTFVMIAGGIDLSVGSVLVFANVAAAKVMGSMGTDNTLTLVVGLLVALASGCAWGIFNGLCIAKLRVPALITTLGTLGAALGVADLLTAGNDIRDVPLKLINIGVDEFFTLSWLVWVGAIVALIGGLVLWMTRFGRHTYVIGSNAEAARRAAINVDRHLIVLYALSGTAAGLAGMMSLAQFATTTISGHSTDVLIVSIRRPWQAAKGGAKMPLKALWQSRHFEAFSMALTAWRVASP